MHPYNFFLFKEWGYINYIIQTYGVYMKPVWTKVHKTKFLSVKFHNNFKNVNSNKKEN